MAVTTQKIRVDLNTGKVIPVAYTHQNDSARTFIFDMYNDGLPYTMTGNTVKFAYKSPIVNGQYTVIAGSSMASGTVSGNTVSVTLPAAYTAISGVGLLTMIITPTSGTIRPVNIKFIVQKSADGDDEIAGASDFPAALDEIAENWLDENISIQIDDTLSVSGKAADAKVTGDEISELDGQIGDLKSDLNNVIEDNYDTTTKGVHSSPTGWRLNESDGLCSEDSAYKLIKYAVTEGDLLKIVSDDRFQFQSTASVPSTGTPTRIGKTYMAGIAYVTVPIGATFLILSTPVENSIAVAYGLTDKLSELQSELQNEDTRLKSDIKHANEGNEIFGLYDSFVNGTQENGVYNHWYTFRVTNENILSFDRDLHVTVKSGYRFFLAIFVDGSYVSDVSWQTSKYTIQKNTNFKIVIAKNPEASGTADIDEYVNAVTFATTAHEKTFGYIDDNIVTVNKSLKQVYPASLLLDKNNYTMTDIRHLRMIVANTDTWQPSSCIKFENLAVYQNQSIYVHTDARSINGTSITTCAAIFYKDSNGDTISTYTIQYGTSGVNMSTGACDVVVKAPAGCTKITVEFWGIAGATPQIGDEVWIDGACVVVGNIKFKDSFCDPAVIYALPSTWASKIQTIQTAQKGYFTFGVQTDTHFINNVGWNFGGDNFSKLTTYVGLDFICNLGDIIRGYNTSLDTPAKTRESYNVLMHRYVTNLKCPLLLTIGNHDTGQSYAQTQSDPTLELSLAEIYSRIMPFVFNSTPKIVSNGRSLYYYVDFDESNIRVIVANTTDGEGSIHDGYPSMFCISQAQLTWLTTVALDTDKQVIFMAHCPLLESLTENRVENGTAMLQALSDFKSGGGNLIGCFYGHTHRQSHAVDEDGILHMTFNDGAECAEVVIVDTTNKVINTYGLGVDQDGNQNPDRGPISY